MTFQTLYEQVALKFQDTENKRYGADTLQIYKDMVNEGVLYIARFLSSDSFQAICKKIGIDPLNYIKELVIVTPGTFTTAGNEITLPESGGVPDWLSILYYKINDYPVLIGKDGLIRQQKYNSFMEGTAKMPVGYQRGKYMKVWPSYVAGDTYEISYVKVPATLTLVGDVPKIDLALHNMIVDVAVGKLYNFDGDDARATVILGQVETDIRMIIGLPAKVK